MLKCENKTYFIKPISPTNSKLCNRKKCGALWLNLISSHQNIGRENFFSCTPSSNWHWLSSEWQPSSDQHVEPTRFLQRASQQNEKGRNQRKTVQDVNSKKLKLKHRGSLQKGEQERQRKQIVQKENVDKSVTAVHIF